MNKKELKFSIFSVCDYKGGELYSSLNLGYISFMNHLVDDFENFFDDPDSYVDFSEEDYELYVNNDYIIPSEIYDKYITKEVLLNYFFSRFGIYAGGGDIVENWYIIDNGKLIEYGLDDEDKDYLVELVKKNYK